MRFKMRGRQRKSSATGVSTEGEMKESRYRKLTCQIGILISVTAFAAGVWAVDTVTAIGHILPNPTSFHRRAVTLQGVVKEVVPYDAKDWFNQSLCNQEFTLQDETGDITVFWMTRCQAGEDKAVPVTVGEQLLISGTIDAPPTNIKNPNGADFGFRVMAITVVRPKP
jgi:hypothetical protein